MKNERIVISAPGGANVMRMIEEPLPEPGPGEVRIRVSAAGVAFADILSRRNLYVDPFKGPFTPGWDVVGEVDAAGPGAGAAWLGKPVAALTGGTGGYARYVILPTRNLAELPPGVDPALAVALCLNYVTAHEMIHESAHAKSGERLLVHSAAGGLGTAALELGRIAGLELFGTASAGKHAAVSALGATPIDYKSEDFVERIRALPGGGVDIALDPIGGGHLVRSFRCLRRGGRLAAFGFSSLVAGTRGDIAGAFMATMARIALWNLLPNGRTAFFFNIGAVLKKHPERVREELGQLLRWLAEGRIAPRIAARIPLSEAARAHELIESGAVTGKIVLVTGS